MRHADLHASITGSGFACLGSRASGIDFLLVRYFAADVRPEFLDDDGHGVETDLRPPGTGEVPKGSIGIHKLVRVRRCADEGTSRMVAVGGDGRGESGAKNLREVEFLMSGIAAS